MTTKAQNLEEKESSIRFLKMLSPGQTIYTNLKHVSASGMTRTIQVLVTTPEGRIHDISWNVAKIIGWKFDNNRGGVKVSGCGMDMGFHLIYTLSRILFADETNRNMGIDTGNAKDAGYILNQQWL